VNVRAVTSLREFDALAPAWNALAEHTGQVSPLASHDWFACCWRTAGPDRRREVWVLENGGGAAAFLPFVRARLRVCGLPFRRLSVLGSTQAPFVEFPAACSADDLSAALLRALGARRDWDMVSLGWLHADSALVKALVGVLADRFPWWISKRIEAPYVTIEGTWEEFVRRRPSAAAGEWQAAEEQLQRRGAVSVEEHRQVDPDGPIFQDLVEVQGTALTPMQGPSRFLRELTRRASVKGWLHLWILRLAGRAVAAEYQIGANGTLHALRADRDRTLGGLPAEAYLSLRVARALFERGGVHEYDLPRGATGATVLASDRRELVTLDIYAPTAFGRLLHALETRLVPVGRRWRRRLAGGRP
jgi:CelD/BcsL family acetyltransferase involved in cellulose biosynthesis